jgi:hypothetical protein
MQINLIPDSSDSVSFAPPQFFTGLNMAVNFLDNLIKNPITVNIEVGYGTLDGTTFNGFAVSEPGPGISVTYSSLVSDLKNSTSSAADAMAYSTLPASDPSGGAYGPYSIAPAQAKALGLMPAGVVAGEVDGAIGFGPSACLGQTLENFVGTVLHELTHALGRSWVINDQPTVLDLFRYISPGTINVSANPYAADYFSIDGGKTNLDYFDATGSDPSDWGVNSGAAANDAFNAYAGPDNAFTLTDRTELDILYRGPGGSSGDGYREGNRFRHRVPLSEKPHLDLLRAAAQEPQHHCARHEAARDRPNGRINLRVPQGEMS